MIFTRNKILVLTIRGEIWGRRRKNMKLKLKTKNQLIIYNLYFSFFVFRFSVLYETRKKQNKPRKRKNQKKRTLVTIIGEEETRTFLGVSCSHTSRKWQIYPCCAHINQPHQMPLKLNKFLISLKMAIFSAQFASAVALIIAASLCLIEANQTGIGIEIGSRGQREFDYFNLALQWPGTFCQHTRHCCSSNACCRGFILSSLSVFKVAFFFSFWLILIWLIRLTFLLMVWVDWFWGDFYTLAFLIPAQILQPCLQSVSYQHIIFLYCKDGKHDISWFCTWSSENTKCSYLWVALFLRFQKERKKDCLLLFLKGHNLKIQEGVSKNFISLMIKVGQPIFYPLTVCLMRNILTPIQYVNGRWIVAWLQWWNLACLLHTEKLWWKRGVYF